MSVFAFIRRVPQFCCYRLSRTNGVAPAEKSSDSPAMPAVRAPASAIFGNKKAGTNAGLF
jgi:hypothetical protein